MTASHVIVIALISVGAIFVYALGNMDVSIGKQVGLYATLMVYFGNKTGSLLPGIVISLIIAIMIAIINGGAGQVLHIIPIVPSLVFMFILSGISTVIYTKLGSRNISLSSIDYSVFKNPVLMLVILVVEVVIVNYFFNYTKYGKYAKAIGANSVAAEQSGINLLKYKVICYVIMSVCVVLGAIFQMGYTDSTSDSIVLFPTIMVILYAKMRKKSIVFFYD